MEVEVEVPYSFHTKFVTYDVSNYICFVRQMYKKAPCLISFMTNLASPIFLLSYLEATLYQPTDSDMMQYKLPRKSVSKIWRNSLRVVILILTFYLTGIVTLDGQRVRLIVWDTVWEEGRLSSNVKNRTEEPECICLAKDDLQPPKHQQIKDAHSGKEMRRYENLAELWCGNS